MSAAQIVVIRLGLRIESEANGREHWRKKAARAKRHRLMASYALRMSLGSMVVFEPPATITLTRIAPRDLDSDNLAGGFKAARDGIADWLEMDDGDKRLTWLYAQRRGKPKEYDAEVVIQWELTL